jgi:xanthine dehydrogenase YagR molybdenum-binding subunit
MAETNLMTSSAAHSMTVIGKSRTRIDGPLKVTGSAQYTSDHGFPGMLYAVPVGATIASGIVETVDTARARQMPGVRAIFKHGDLGKISRINPDFMGMYYTDEPRPPLDDDVVRYYGQYIALVVADTFEQAKVAADAVNVTYKAEKANVDHRLKADATTVVSERGDADAGFAGAPVAIDVAYGIATETHNPIETHATIAVPDGDTLTLYETTQGVVNHRDVVADMLGLPRDKVRVVSKFLGSGFGNKLFPWSQSPLAGAAALSLKKPVKLVLSRPMMFYSVGHRPRTEQRMRIGATKEGKLVSLQHDYVNATSILDDYVENCGEATPHMYSVPNLRVTSGLAKRNIGSPTSMRGPGAVPGLFALESAMDELAIKLGMDPIQVRMLNEPSVDEGSGLPFTSRHFQECMSLGAQAFGWARRDPKVGSMQRDGLTVGWGMAACSWLAARFNCSASIELRDNGTVRVASAVQDIGTGTYTAMAQMAAELLGVDVGKVEVVLGDTDLPAGPVSGGSMLTSSLIPPIIEAVAAAGRELIARLAVSNGSLFKGANPDDLRFSAGRITAGSAGSQSLRFDEALRAAGAKSVSGEGTAGGTFPPPQPPTFSSHSFGAHFVEVTWQPEIARLRVSRMVSVIDAGRILNPLAARSQIEGALVMGIGMALFEGTEYDPQNGAPINASFADYVVPVNADVPAIDVHFVEHPDLEQNAFGARGVGEIGLAGTAAAIANAVYHATGIRCRELPLRIEHLL